MTPEQRLDYLNKAGEALYGARWQVPLSRELRVDGRTVRRWVAGDNEVPWGIMAELRGLMMAQSVRINDLLREMDQPHHP